MVDDIVASAPIVGSAVVGNAVVGDAVVGTAVVGADKELPLGAAVVVARTRNCAAVVDAAVVGAVVVGATVVGLAEGRSLGAAVGLPRLIALPISELSQALASHASTSLRESIVVAATSATSSSFEVFGTGVEGA